VIVVLHENDVRVVEEVCPFLGELRASGRFSAAELGDMARYCANSPASSLYETLAVLSATYRLFHEGLARVEAALWPAVGRFGYVDRWLARDGVEYRLVEFSLDRIKQATDQAKARLMVVTYPTTANLTAEDRMVAVFAGLERDLQAKLLVPVYSGYGAFLGNQRAKRTMVWSLTDKHPNCEAHDIFADWLLERYRASFPVVSSRR
jgi:hypothetical protein